MLPFKLFTIEDVKAHLPLIQVIVRDILLCYERLGKLRSESRSITRRFSRSGSRFKPGQIQEASTRSQAIRLARRDNEKHLDELHSELRELGCYLINGQQGLVGFPSVRNDDLISLCWFYGDLEVTYFCTNLLYEELRLQRLDSLRVSAA